MSETTTETTTDSGQEARTASNGALSAPLALLIGIILMTGGLSGVVQAVAEFMYENGRLDAAVVAKQAYTAMSSEQLSINLLLPIAVSLIGMSVFAIGCMQMFLLMKNDFKSKTTSE